AGQGLMDLLDQAGLPDEARDLDLPLDDNVRSRSETPRHASHEGAVTGIRIRESLPDPVRILDVRSRIRLDALNPPGPGAGPVEQAGVDNGNPDVCTSGRIPDAWPQRGLHQLRVGRLLRRDDSLRLCRRAHDVGRDDERVLVSRDPDAEPAVQISNDV